MKSYRIFVVLIIVALSIGALNAQNIPNLVITTIDGQKQSLSLKDYPLMTMDNDVLKVTTSNVCLSYDLQQVADIKYVDPSGVNDVDLQSEYILNNDNLYLFAQDRPIDTQVYSINGVLIKTLKLNQGSYDCLNLSSLSPGIYIIKVNDISVKILKQ